MEHEVPNRMIQKCKISKQISPEPQELISKSDEIKMKDPN